MLPLFVTVNAFSRGIEIAHTLPPLARGTQPLFLSQDALFCRGIQIKMFSCDRISATAFGLYYYFLFVSTASFDLYPLHFSADCDPDFEMCARRREKLCKAGFGLRT